MSDRGDELGGCLGLLRAGRYAEAAAAGRRAAAADPGSADAWYLLGVACHGAGAPGEAEACYRQSLGLRPGLPEPHFHLGNALLDLGRPGEAEGCLREALRLRPDFPEAHYSLGNALDRQGRPREAEACFREALRLRPDFAEAHNNLGNVLLDLDRPREAEACFREALRLRPDLPEPHNNLGNALQRLGRPDEAEGCFRTALRLRPDYPDAYCCLGNVLLGARRPREAEGCFREALRLRPDYAEAHNSLGNALSEQGRLPDAVACFREALCLKPDYAEVYSNLGNTLSEMGRLQDAEACFREALRLKPDYADAHNNLGHVRRDLGRPDEAEACYRDALRLRPDFHLALSNLLLTLQYREGITAAELAGAHAEFQERFAAPLRATWRPHANGRDPGRRLRLGFVSPDFARHPVGYLTARALEALARRPADCAVACYSDRPAPDELTARFRAAAALWRDTAGLSDERLAEQVRSDAIDVLFDLAGHTRGGRPLLFARKPAPVQLAWVGYEGTTGLEAIDALVADDRLVPVGAEPSYRERVLRLPGGYVCYEPPAQAPPVGSLPALAAGRVAFGCFNNPAKVSPAAVAAWADVLRRVPGARLILKYRGLDDPAQAARLRALFAQHGTDPARVELRGKSPFTEYLAAYGEIDIALDPFPFTGGVTTCDALWMGVPVVSLIGDTFAGRHSLSHLAGAGLAELAAADPDSYVQTAASLAHDLPRLAGLRAGLRARVAASPLCDGGRLAGELLAAVRLEWRRWAADQS